MAPILSFPFRFALDGRAAVVDQASETAAAEQIAVLALTRAGERRLRPAFGLTDPTFAGFSPSELAAKVELYGPPVDIRDITVQPSSVDVQKVTVDFEAA